MVVIGYFVPLLHSKQIAMKVKDILSALHQWAPPALQESYDNSGLIVGSPEQEVTQLLVSLDCTEAVVQEAIVRGCQAVVSHHPIVFGQWRQQHTQNKRDFHKVSKVMSFCRPTASPKNALIKSKWCYQDKNARLLFSSRA
jgi:hypothetical protein